LTQKRYDENKKIIKYEELDGEMASMFEKYLDAKINYITATANFTLGFPLPNGSFTGTLGQIENLVADMSCNCRLLQYQNTSNCAYLDPVDVINMKYMVPKQNATSIKLQFSILQMFSFQGRCIFLIVCVLMIILWYFIDAISIVIFDDHESSQTLKDLIFNSISVLSSVAIPDKKITKSHDRIILAFLLMFSLTVCNTFQGTITSLLSSPKKTHEINTLQELIKSDLNLYALVVIKGKILLFKMFYLSITMCFQIFSNQMPMVLMLIKFKKNFIIAKKLIQVLS
jgi:hypothetical protein